MGNVGKLAIKWEGSFKVIRKLNAGTYYLEDAEGKALKHPGNAFNLCQFFS